jgi:uncharacterized protein (TIGR04222 family)
MPFNPLDMKGPAFLFFYIVLLVVALALGWALRRFLSGPGGEPPPEADALGPYETAYLSGGPTRVTEAATAALVHAGHLKVDADNKGRLAAGPAPIPTSAEAIELALYDAAKNGARPMQTQRATRAAAASYARVPEMLGLTPDNPLAARLFGALPIALVLALGIAKFAVGIARDKPIGLLLLLLVVTFFCTAALGLMPVWASRKGEAALRRLKSENQALRASVGSTKPAAVAMTPDDFGFAVALYGTQCLALGPHADLHRLYHAPSSGGDAGSSSSSCSSSSCGSSSCGGGGGGCGGCGS